MKTKFLSMVLLVCFGLSYAQDKVKYTDEELKMLKTYYFNEGFNKPATQKVSTVIMKDGTKHRGYCKTIITKKGQIAQMVFKDSITDKKETYDADQIKEAFLYASGFEKYNKVTEKFSNYGMGKRNSLKKITSNDQIYFVNQTVSLKNKRDDKEFLMQLINPDFSDYIDVYHDPFAKETQGVKFGAAPRIGGGIIKSYYVKKGDKVLWLHKADFEENYDFLFGDSPEFMAKYPYKSVDWDWFSGLVVAYTKMRIDAM